MVHKGGSPAEEVCSAMGPHEEFLELCAVSTSGDLTEEEKTKLQKHLAGCPECREALKEFQAAANISSPLFASEASAPPPLKQKHGQLTRQRQNSGSVLARQISPTGSKSVGPHAVRADELPERNGKPRLSEHWNTVWLPFAAAILLAATLGIYAYRAGVRRGGENATVPQRAIEQPSAPLQQQVSDAAHDREVLLAQMAERDKMIANLRRQVEERVGRNSQVKGYASGSAKCVGDRERR